MPPVQRVSGFLQGWWDIHSPRTPRGHPSAFARDGKGIMKPDLFWIPGPCRGRLAVAARPRGGDWLEDEASGWRRAGIDVIVSLLEADEAAQLDLVDEAKAAGANGIRFMSFPIPDRGVPASAAAAVSLIAAISDALEKGDNVAVDCRQGVGRSGVRESIPSGQSRSSVPPAARSFRGATAKMTGQEACPTRAKIYTCA
jgi:hypothetical protein